MNSLHKHLLITGIIALVCSIAPAPVFAGQSKVIKMRGEVKVRKGLNEDWDRAVIGMLLRDVDTILTLESAEVVLLLESGDTFTLGSNAVVDIGDLRKISERQLFLFLVSKKNQEAQAAGGKRVSRQFGELGSRRRQIFRRRDRSCRNAGLGAGKKRRPRDV